jgi:hypothetical protein
MAAFLPSTNYIVRYKVLCVIVIVAAASLGNQHQLSQSLDTLPLHSAFRWAFHGDLAMPG